MYSTQTTIIGPEGKQKSTKKRIRTIFTPEQLKRLEQEFSNQMYLVGDYRYLLAQSLNLSEAQVKVWFQNRRIKQRKLQSGGGGGADVCNGHQQ